MLIYYLGAFNLTGKAYDSWDVKESLDNVVSARS